MTKQILDVVLPVLNEDKNIFLLIKQIHDICMSSLIQDISLRFIVVDDGSTDNTWDILKNIKNEYNYLCAIRFTRNFGKEAAIYAGLSFSTGDCCIVMDADFQHPPSLIPEMIKIWNTGDYLVVHTVPNKANYKKDRFFLDILCTNMFYRIYHWFTGMNIKGFSDFKLIDRKVVKTLIDYQDRITFFRGMVSWLGYKSYTLTYDYCPQQRPSRWNFIKLFIYGASNILLFSTTPLIFVLILSCFLIFLSIVSIFAMLSNIVINIHLLYFVTFLFFSVSVFIFTIYLLFIYSLLVKKPKYVIQEILC